MSVNRLLALLRGRCPHCLRGDVFRGFFDMHERCPTCGVLYRREDGYFMNAIFMGYVLGFLLLIPTLLILYVLRASPLVFTLVTTLVLLLASPLIMRYARLMWMHLDELLDPRPRNAGGSDRR